jgi:hypothetical protein
MCTYSDALESAFSARQRRVTAVHRRPGTTPRHRLSAVAPHARPQPKARRRRVAAGAGGPRGAAGLRLARAGRAARRADPDPGARQGHRRDE